MNSEHLGGPWVLFFQDAAGRANGLFASVQTCVAGLAALTDFADELSPNDALCLLPFGQGSVRWARDSQTLDNSRAWARRLGL